ncbi:acetoacetate decarboxylase family protein [Fortiea contorta]|uniref:acetoacetate decarboxylase family protein n=1 Tax=Fortiea contorta TaxID=1892405 RepID=UPI0003467CC7|nr:acetoacetate decarboxylase family protein [Fortiea contorta]
MPYPKTPWTLIGLAIQTLHLIDIDRVRHLIPAELNIIALWPGKTLASVYLSNYQSGSVLEYSELIVAPAVVSYQGKIGGWISHIYVDNPDSVAGGREIWGLPKELADFAWENGKHVTVRQQNRLLCSLSYGQQSWAWKLRLGASVFSTMGADLLMFPTEFASCLSLVGSHLEVPPESPFADIGLGKAFLTVRCEQLNLRVDAPTVVGQRKVEVSWR